MTEIKKPIESDVIPNLEMSDVDTNTKVPILQAGVSHDIAEIVIQPTTSKDHREAGRTDEYEEYLDWFLKTEEYEFACQLLGKAEQWGISPQQKLRDAERLIRDMLLKGSKDDRTSYPSLYYGSQLENYITRDTSGQIHTDSRAQFKYDLINSLGFSREELQDIVFAVQQELFAGFRELIEELKNSYYRTSVTNALHPQMRKICRLQLKIPIENPQYLASLQEAVRAIAPDLLRYDKQYLLQEIANEFNVPWYGERMQYADRALEGLFTEMSDEGRFPFDVALHLQETYMPPVSPQRRKQAMRGLWYGITRTTKVERYAACFGLTMEECRKVAADGSGTAIRDYVTRASKKPHYSDGREDDRGEAVLVHHLMEDYGLSAEDIGPLRVATDEWEEACLKKRVNNGAELSTTIDRQREGYLDKYLPDLLRSVLLRAMRNPGRSHFAAVCETLSNAPQTSKIWETSCLDLVREPHEQPLLDLNQESERTLWLKLFTGAQLEPGGMVELRAFLESAELPPDEVIAAWRAASNDSTRKNVYGKRYCDYMGTPLVFERNVGHIARLQHVCPGAAAELHREWGISMFSRYPIEVLHSQVQEERAIRVARQGKRGLDRQKQENDSLPPPATGRKLRKKNFIVLYPEHDWNGAFERPDFIQDLDCQARLNDYNFRIAESGRRNSCLRRLAKFYRQFGSVDLAVIGGHSDGASIDVSGDSDQAIRLTGMDPENDKHQKFLKHLRSYFSRNGKLIFKACSTGKEVLDSGKPGIARHAEQLIEIETTGPVEPAYLQSIHLERREATWAKEGGGGLVLSNTFTPPTRWERFKAKIAAFMKKSK